MTAQPFSRERDFQRAVCQLAKALGCIVYHTHDSRRSEPGFPDLVIVGKRGFMFRELKQPKGISAPSSRCGSTSSPPPRPTPTCGARPTGPPASPPNSRSIA